MTAIIAILLEVIPMMGARYYLKKDRSDDYYILGALAAAFGLLVFALILLRCYTMEQMFSSASTRLNIAGITTESNTYSPTNGEYAMTFLMSMLPILTSVAAFILTIMNSLYDKLKNMKKLHEIQIADTIIKQMAYAKEIEQELKIDLVARDNVLYERMNKAIEDRAQEMKCRVRELVAEKRGTPQAVTELLETDTESEQQENTHNKNKNNRRFKAA